MENGGQTPSVLPGGPGMRGGFRGRGHRGYDNGRPFDGRGRGRGMSRGGMMAPRGFGGPPGMRGRGILRGVPPRGMGFHHRGGPPRGMPMSRGRPPMHYNPSGYSQNQIGSSQQHHHHHHHQQQPQQHQQAPQQQQQQQQSSSSSQSPVVESNPIPSSASVTNSVPISKPPQAQSSAGGIVGGVSGQTVTGGGSIGGPSSNTNSTGPMSSQISSRGAPRGRGLMPPPLRGGVSSRGGYTANINVSGGGGGGDTGIGGGMGGNNINSSSTGNGGLLPMKSYRGGGIPRGRGGYNGQGMTRPPLASQQTSMSQGAPVPSLKRAPPVGIPPKRGRYEPGPMNTRPYVPKHQSSHAPPINQMSHSQPQNNYHSQPSQIQSYYSHHTTYDQGATQNDAYAQSYSAPASSYSTNGYSQGYGQAQTASNYGQPSEYDHSQYSQEYSSSGYPQTDSRYQGGYDYSQYGATDYSQAPPDYGQTSSYDSRSYGYDANAYSQGYAKTDAYQNHTGYY